MISLSPAMTTLETRCLDAFPAWLKTLGDDARALAAVVENGEVPESARRRAAAALNYLFKSLDLIPDGLEDLGFIDDAFVFRVAAAGIDSADAAGDASGVVTRLASEAALISEFLGDIHGRLQSYVGALEQGSARGRTVDEIMKDEGKRGELVREVRQWADAYEVPGFTRDEKNLVKLRSFLSAKLKA